MASSIRAYSSGSPISCSHLSLRPIPWISRSAFSTVASASRITGVAWIAATRTVSIGIRKRSHGPGKRVKPRIWIVTCRPVALLPTTTFGERWRCSSSSVRVGADNFEKRHMLVLRVFLPLGTALFLLGIAKTIYDITLNNLSESAIFALSAVFFKALIGFFVAHFVHNVPVKGQRKWRGMQERSRGGRGA